MTDLDLIRDIRPDAPLPEPGDLVPARGRLIAAIAAERADGHRPEQPPPVVRRPRRGGVHGRAAGALWPPRRLALTAAVAAAVAAAATALVAIPGHGGPPAVAQKAPATVDVAAARFLRHAAAAAQLQHASPPGPDQFVYTETEGVGGADKDQQWLSTYGNRDGLLGNAGQRSYVVTPCTVAQTQIAQKSPPGSYPPTFHCTEVAGYLPSMPTDPHVLLAYLDKVGIANTDPSLGTDWEANDIGKAVDFLMQTTYLLPAQQAALFELMAQTPGFTLVQHAQDAVGRTGIGVMWIYEGSRAEIILNPVTYAYLGDRTWSAPGFRGPGANNYHGAALIKLAFVDKAGQIP
jgi:hypothetical protein